jgi:hypothetical protein
MSMGAAYGIEPPGSGKIGGAEPVRVTNNNSMQKAQIGLPIGESLTTARRDDKIVTVDNLPSRDRRPAEKAPAELPLPGADTGGDVSRAREAYPEGCT